MTQNHPELLQQIKESVEKLGTKIIKNRGFTTPYTITLRNIIGDYEQYDIIITPGNPVTIIIHDRFALWCLNYEKYIILRSTLEAGMERMHLVHRTLSHLVSLEKSIALKKETKTWMRILTPQLSTRITSKYLKIEYTVKVTDSLSNTSLELHGDNPLELKEMAIERLSRMVLENEDLAEIYENLQDVDRVRNIPVKASIITVIGDATEQVKMRVEY